MKFKLNLTILILLGSFCMPSFGQFGQVRQGEGEDVAKVETAELRTTWADMYTGHVGRYHSRV